MGILREWLKQTYKVSLGYQETRKRIVCKDGFSMSVQAGRGMYSIPRINLENGYYLSVEIGFPSENEELICKYAEDETNYKETIYPFVPVEVVESVIEKHGGMAASNNLLN